MRSTTLLVLLLCLVPDPRSAAAATPAEEEECFDCHDDEALVRKLPSGERISLDVDPDAFAASVHGKTLACHDCHAGMEAPHARIPAADRQSFRRTFRDTCKRCHFDKYAQFLDGVHYRALEKGNDKAPWCPDCHDAHTMTAAARPRAKISATCARCHSEIDRQYRASVHGRALTEDKSDDVPVCTDCHRSHDMRDPRVESWLVMSPSLCGQCHGDEKRMAKYGLSTRVIRSYLWDFHGTTVKLRQSLGTGGSEIHGIDRLLERAARSNSVKDDAFRRRLTARRAGKGSNGHQLTALCIDCHGVHDIARPDEAHSPVLRANLVKTCRRCHPKASDRFPDAWLSHYEPSLARAPLVYGVTLFYRILIPTMVGGLCLQILLHLWRAVVGR